MVKTITMMDFRKSPGERIIDVMRNRDTFLLTKQGKVVAKLCPPDEGDETVVHSDGSITGRIPVTFGQNLGEGGY